MAQGFLTSSYLSADQFYVLHVMWPKSKPSGTSETGGGGGASQGYHDITGQEENNMLEKNAYAVVPLVAYCVYT